MCIIIDYGGYALLACLGDQWKSMFYLILLSLNHNMNY